MVRVRRQGCTPIACLVSIAFFVVVVACIGGIFFGVTGLIRNSDVVQEARARAERDPEVAAALGTPLEIGWLSLGSIETSNGGGSADLTLPVSGPRGSGQMIVEAVRREGVWQYRRLIVTVGDRQIDVLRER
ncbi:MAG: cytochrome c oxidase assembly factor Coa1 family protein [Roseiflexaceae bacterium]|nr:cytochrome c oxidase assembly factor 1 family protein [Roseiflexus sp.]MDW8213664.1 cytochrome c oxidase assembly factor Coa1 family protein [Roseiflexaceae bacterium]